jgi:hypothetical protein
MQAQKADRFVKELTMDMSFSYVETRLKNRKSKAARTGVPVPYTAVFQQEYPHVQLLSRGIFSLPAANALTAPKNQTSILLTLRSRECREMRHPFRGTE